MGLEYRWAYPFCHLTPGSQAVAITAKGSTGLQSSLNTFAPIPPDSIHSDGACWAVLLFPFYILVESTPRATSKSQSASEWGHDPKLSAGHCTPAHGVH